MKKKKRKKMKTKKKLKIAAACLGGAGLTALLFFGGFQVRHVEVEGNTRYTEEEICSMALKDPLAFNTVLLTTFHAKVDMRDIPFMEYVEFEYLSNDTVRINVEEKKTVGYVAYQGQKVYFDKDGIVLECIPDESAQEAPEGQQPLTSEPIGEPAPADPSAVGGSAPEEDTASGETATEGETLSADKIQSARVTVSEFHPTLDNVPLVQGLVFDRVEENQRLSVQDPSVFRTILAITRMIEKYQICPDYVEFGEGQTIQLQYEDTVRVALGKDDNLEEKMTKLAAILPSLSGMSGVLHLEDYKESSDSFVFARDVQEGENTQQEETSQEEGTAPEEGAAEE